MPITMVTTSTYIRPNTNVEFKNHPLEFKNHIKKYYVDTGKILSKQETLSEDGLTLTIVMYWDRPESRTQYTNDPVVNEGWERQKVYNQSNGITFRSINQEFDGSALIKETVVSGNA